MVSPKGKTPSRTEIKEMQTVSERIKKYGPQIKKFFPQFDKLNTKQKNSLTLKKAVQDIMGDDNESYTDEEIRNQGLSMLGVASGKYDDYETVSKDSAGRRQTLAKQKKQNPAGFAHGGRVHRGRTASGSAEK